MVIREQPDLFDITKLEVCKPLVVPTVCKSVADLIACPACGCDKFDGITCEKCPYDGEDDDIVNYIPLNVSNINIDDGIEKGSGIIIVDINLPNSSTTIQYEIKYKFKITKTYIADDNDILFDFEYLYPILGDSELEKRMQVEIQKIDLEQKIRRAYFLNE